MSQSHLLLAFLFLLSGLIAAQSAETPDAHTFQVSAAAWTDTALDLQPGQTVVIAAASR